MNQIILASHQNRSCQQHHVFDGESETDSNFWGRRFAVVFVCLGEKSSSPKQNGETWNHRNVGRTRTHSHRNNVGYIYLHLVHVLPLNVGKYSIYGSYVTDWPPIKLEVQSANVRCDARRRSKLESMASVDWWKLKILLQRSSIEQWKKHLVV